jgi:4-hydroxybenzoate polyprenyltransferase
MDLLDSSWLFASLIWGSIGVGYCIYGKRQESLPSFIAGLLMIVASYFVSSVLVMSLACVALMVAVYVIAKRGW